MKTVFKTIALSTALTLMPLAAFATTMKADINGLVCAFCAQSLEKVLKKQPEVADIKVDMDSKLVTITFKDGQSLSAEKASALITDAGYAATNFRVEE